MMSFSFASIFQYVVVTGVAYVLIIAPLTKTLFGIGQHSYDGLDDNVDISASKLRNIVIPDPALQCPEHGYKTRILARSPLVIYIENFLSEKEVEHLKELSEPFYHLSTVTTSPTNTTYDPSIRRSHKAKPPRTQIVRCIEARSREFQGPHPSIFTEHLWTQKYHPGGHYRHHYDYGSASRRSGRVSSFMVWLQAPERGGGTEFPRLEHPCRGSRDSIERREWCRFIDCPVEERHGTGQREQEDIGVTFKPIARNAVYWENFDVDMGTPYEEVWHAGLPVDEGVKIGLNIWSWLQRGYIPTDADRIAMEDNDPAVELARDATEMVSGEKAE
ncbi:hypothetical protein EJ05DRAFT_464045 [Pseudovirgaria hyperparasitica]|uniref:Prolyl 4-hydroxylase alpha subunit domain-containing protein n=1 Tax=Pseudovirgaria hyperparasitica TaxID=470096 RepID=A0A6A6W994_9PEZI|nr:uncharacterized protein EJ05DRAFT_464045 [Pseudovirgaria hyperparasitica]KAF2759422.1 hypothetical protein EJ05DRAFT_464045 [Pseudovirgaria hyperparasitica]